MNAEMGGACGRNGARTDAALLEGEREKRRGGRSDGVLLEASAREEDRRLEWCLRRAATSGGKLPDVVQEDRALKGVELRGVGGDLGEEGVGHENGRLVAMAGIGVAKQGRDIDLQSPREAVQGREGGHRLAVLDLGDVGAGDVHAGSKLTLGQVADMAQVADGCGYLETTLLLGRWGDESEGCWCRFSYLNFEGFAAAAAKRAGGAELHQAAIVTTQNLTLFDGRHHGCHKLCVAKGPRARTHARPITDMRCA
jgi:hypothetical protein